MKQAIKFNCPYCNYLFLRGSRGYGNHLKAKHPAEYSMGLRLYTGKPAASWPLIVIHKTTKVDLVGDGVDSNTEPDLVNHPPHYTFGKYEVIDVLQDWFADDPLLWQVVKYLARARHKGNELQDLRKAEFYLQRRIVALAGQEVPSPNA